MKLVKNLVFAMVLASVLAISAPAGELQTPGYAPPPPPPSQVVIGRDDGTGVSDPADGSTETSDDLYYEALAALLSMY